MTYYLINYPPMMPVTAMQFIDLAAANAAAEKRERCVIVHEAEQLRPLGGPILVQLYNHCCSTPVKRFSDLDAAVTRTWAALEAKFQNLATIAETQAAETAAHHQAAAEPGAAAATEENTDVAKAAKIKKPKTEKKARTPRKIGQDAKRVGELGTMREGTARAKVLKMMDGTHTMAAIAKAIENTDDRVLAHAYCTWRDVGIGYKLNEAGKLEALYPGTKGYDDVVKPAKEKAATKA